MRGARRPVDDKEHCPGPFRVGAWRGQLFRDGLTEIPVDGEIGIRAAELADFHRDPSGRLIVVTALGGHRLVTADRRILDWAGPLSCLRAGD